MEWPKTSEITFQATEAKNFLHKVTWKLDYWYKINIGHPVFFYIFLVQGKVNRHLNFVCDFFGERESEKIFTIFNKVDFHSFFIGEHNLTGFSFGIRKEGAVPLNNL